MIRCGLLIALIMFGASALKAKVTLPSMFCDNMVLQQKTVVPVWGHGIAGQQVKVVGSWMSQDTVKATINPNGQWKVMIPTTKAGGPYTLTIIGSSTIKLANVLLGEVWLCSGQSNMEWRPEIGIKNKEKEIEAAQYPEIRFFNVENRGADYPQNDCEGQWVECSPQTMPQHSAIAYFFARELQRKLKVPVGLITAEWGGTPAEVWLPQEAVEGNILLNNNKPVQPFEWWPIQSGVLYNQMIHPIIQYRIAGTIWYQGESNEGRYSTYHLLMKTLIEQWRAKNGENFPFYFVQIAPFNYKSKYNTAALLREQQEMTWKEVPNTGMVVINDLVDNVNDIHPQDKQNVGLRLANYALAEKYQLPITGYKSPTFKALTRVGNKITVQLNHAVKGILCKGKEVAGIAVTDHEGQQVNAQVKVEKGELTISAKKLPTPLIVSYCFDDATVGNLFSVDGELPIAPFRAFEGGAEKPKVAVGHHLNDVFIPSHISNVHLNGYLGMRMEKNITERLLQVEEAGLIEPYTKRPGNHPWAGEHIGKYLETASNVWLNCGNEQVKKQMDRMAIQLIGSQLEDGYLGTYPDADHWKGWDVWSHKYNLYGLLAYYKATAYQPALTACRKMGDLLCRTFGKETGKKDIIEAGTHIGMAATSVLDPMIELYKYTGEKKYLDFCYYLIESWEQENGPKIISSLLASGKVNKVANGKAYEMLSNLLGLTKFYRLTSDDTMLKPVEIAWQDITKNRLYITGTTSSYEFFQEDGKLKGSNDNNVGEGCVTTTWMQLNQSLFEATGDLKYLNELEKTIYNHLLAAENPHTGGVSYFTPLIGQRYATCQITCCMSSIPRGIASIPLSTFGNVKGVPTLLLYESGSYKESYTTPAKQKINLSLIVDSRFPEKDAATITVKTSTNATFPLALRVPSWCESYIAQIGNENYVGKANEYLIINRKWKSVDKIEVSFSTPLQQIMGDESYPHFTALKRGPQVLAFDTTLNKGDVRELIKKENILRIEALESINNPQLLPKGWIGKQAYDIKVEGGKSIILVPFAEAAQMKEMATTWLPLSKYEY